MADIAPKTRILRIRPEPGEIHGCGYGGCEVLATNDNGPQKNTSFLSKIRQDFTKAVIICDKRKIAAVLDELRPYESLIGPQMIHTTRYENIKDFEQNFATRMKKDAFLQKPQSGHDTQFDALKNDIRRNIKNIAPVFNRENPFSLLLRFYAVTNDNVDWHVDSYLRKNEFASIRSLGPFGTLVGCSPHRNCHEDYKINGTLPPLAVHGGQSLCVIKPGTVHKAPYVPVNRWIYRINQIAY